MNQQSQCFFVLSWLTRDRDLVVRADMRISGVAGTQCEACVGWGGRGGGEGGEATSTQLAYASVWNCIQDGEIHPRSSERDRLYASHRVHFR